jgi:methyl-accepting chemotaxis protein
MRTRRLVFVALLLAGACFAVAAVYAHGSWRDLWLNLLAEAGGAAFIVLFVDVLFERSNARERELRRRRAIRELGAILGELQAWLVGMSSNSDGTAGRHEHAADPDLLGADLSRLVRNLGEIDFAAPGIFKRDEYFVEWARRSFDQTAGELARWEWSFVDSAGLFDDGFRHRAESLRRFVRAVSSFLEGMERYIVREKPTSATFAYTSITELTADSAAELVSDLQQFLRFYHEQRQLYGVAGRASNSS